MGYVYMITNTINQKKYIGISIHEPEKRRIKAHLSGYGNRVIANAVKKYGKDAFTYKVLEANVFDEFLPDLEVFYISKYNTVRPHGYNLNSGGEHPKHSDETRRKISEAKKGEKHPYFGKTLSAEHRRKIGEAGKGKKHSAETRRKQSEALKGRKRSAEHRRNISRANKGKKHSAETRRKMSESRKGEKNPNFGKSFPAEVRRKMSEAKKGEKHPNFGKKHSVETRRKMSEALKGENNPQFGKSKKHSAETRRKMSEAAKRRWERERQSKANSPSSEN